MPVTGTVSVKLGVATLPITALQFYGEKLLVGEGPVLHIYACQTESLICSEWVLSPVNIHGIRLEAPECSASEATRVCVFGGKHARIINFSHDFTRIELWSASHEFAQWILDALWLRDDTVIALALAHNSVVLWDSTSNSVLRSIQCAERCILYSACFVGFSLCDLVLLAGTVFNQVVVWPISGAPSDEKTNHLEVMHRLTGHQGVIFAITFDAVHRRLCSASDDRSIRLWVVTFPRSGSEVSHNDWRGANFEPSLVLYGHTARVWGVRLLQEHIVSVGEDACCFVWNYKGQVVQKFKGHKGKSIWSVAVHRREIIVATGGGDCSVRLWRHLAGNVSASATVQRHIPTETAEFDTAMSAVDYPRSVVFLCHLDKISVMSNNGALYGCCLSSWQWILLCRDPRYASYSVLAAWPYCLLVGSMDGHLKTVWINDNFEVTQCWEQIICPGKVLAICCLQTSDSRKLFLTSGPDGKLILWQMDGKRRPFEAQRLVLPPMRQRWVTTASLIHSQRALVCGDRGGSVHVYSLNNGQTESGTTPVQTLHKIHGDAGVTHACCHGGHVFTCGRDGHYRKYSLLHDGTLHMLCSVKVSKGFHWLTRLIFREDGSSFVAGFHMDHFVLEDLGRGERVASQPCGGGHRAWDAVLEHDTARLVYIKERQITTMTFDLAAAKQTVLKPSLHGKQLTDVKHLLSFQHSKGSGSILATGSEDTLINVVLLRTSNRLCTSRVLASIGGHISSVRSLCLLPLGGTTSILFSAGGRAQLNVCKIKLEEILDASERSAEAGVTLDHEAPSSGENRWRCNYEQIATHFLYDQERRGHQVVEEDAETRYMSVTALRLSDWSLEGAGLYIIAVACSDGYIRLFVFNEKDRSPRLLAESEPHSHCFLVVKHVVCGAANQRRAYILSASTDGKVAFWDITDVIVEFVRQSDVKTDGVESDGVANSCLSDGVANSCVSDGVANSCVSERTIGANSVSESEKNCGMNNDGSSQLKDRTSKSRCKNRVRSEVGTMQMAAAVCTIRAHQSGVNSLDVDFLDDDRLILATGGDDNAVGVYVIDISHSSVTASLRVTASATCSKGHAAQITGVKLLACRRRLVATSVDQMLTVWELKLAPSLRIQKITSRVHNISDPACMEVWHDSASVQVAVCGVGLQEVSICDIDSIEDLTE